MGLTNLSIGLTLLIFVAQSAASWEFTDEGYLDLTESARIERVYGFECVSSGDEEFCTVYNITTDVPDLSPGQDFETSSASEFSIGIQFGDRTKENLDERIYINGEKYIREKYDGGLMSHSLRRIILGETNEFLIYLPEDEYDTDNFYLLLGPFYPKLSLEITDATLYNDKKFTFTLNLTKEGDIPRFNSSIFIKFICKLSEVELLDSSMPEGIKLDKTFSFEEGEYPGHAEENWTQPSIRLDISSQEWESNRSHLFVFLGYFTTEEGNYISGPSGIDYCGPGSTSSFPRSPGLHKFFILGYADSSNSEGSVSKEETEEDSKNSSKWFRYLMNQVDELILEEKRKMPRMRLVFIPIGYAENESEEFVELAQQSVDRFLEVGPCRECSNPPEEIETFFMPPSVCEISSCSDICGSRMNDSENCQFLVENCANDPANPYNDRFDLAIGLCKNTSCRRGACGGCAASIPSKTVVVNAVDCGGAAPHKIVTHEVGHGLGLYHISSEIDVNDCWDSEAGACQGPNAADCNESAEDRSHMIMAYCPSMDNYGPAAYDYLETDSLRNYTEVCE